MSTVNFCTCTNRDCKRNPANHENGCTDCIELNLALRKIPVCFFNLADPNRTRNGFDFGEFARIVIENNQTLQNK